MALRLTPRSPRGIGLVSPRRLRIARKLDTSVEVPGPHGLTVRFRCASSAHQQRPSHPAPDVRDDRDAPSGERGTASLNHKFFISERTIFLREGLDMSRNL